MPDKNLEPRKIEFDAPVTESQLQKILDNTLKELDLEGEWHFEHGYMHHHLSKHAINEKLHGFIRLKGDAHAITEFYVGPWKDFSKKPQWGDIAFSPSRGCGEREQLYPKHIDQIYDTFNKNYKSQVWKGKK
jgi:hypothetical protein